VWRSVPALLERRYGDLVWDGVVRGSGAAALTAIPLVLFVSASGPLVAFVLVTVWVNGPIAPFLPATYEPILMMYGRLYPPLVVGLLGIAGTIYIEFLNYALYRKMLATQTLAPVRASKVVRKLDALFSRAPFFTVWLCSWSPLPYWSVRFLSPLTGFPVSRHLLATFLGRFPRLWFFAALGVWWQIDLGILAAVAVGSIVVAALVWGAGASSPSGARRFLHQEPVEEIVGGVERF
jgi:uncharacterized membrane protein YdjX (TVP38/TMEM64 family)